MFYKRITQLLQQLIGGNFSILEVNIVVCSAEISNRLHLIYPMCTVIEEINQEPF